MELNYVSVGRFVAWAHVVLLQSMRAKPLDSGELDLDRHECWRSNDIRPLIFIMGLHRSGTTFLYECLSKVLPVSKITLQDVVFYPQIVSSYDTDRGSSDRDALNSYLRDSGKVKRGTDNLDLDADIAEEYGWILRRLGGSFITSPTTVEFLEDLVRKVAYMHPQDEAILLKNPWDIGNADYIGTRFPRCRFVFIRRQPIEILNSEVNNLLHFTGSKDPLLSLLTRHAPEKRILFRIMRLLRFLVTERSFSRLVTRLLIRDVASNLVLYQRDIQRLSEERFIEISYDDLTRNTVETIKEIGRFLCLPVNDAAYALRAAHRRSDKLGCVRELYPELQQRLRRYGLDGNS